MPGPPWGDDLPSDSAKIRANVEQLLRVLRVDAPGRAVPGIAVAQRWHAAIYDGCRLPVAGYAGHFRGDPTVPELLGYDVGVGPRRSDGYPDRVGLPAGQVRAGVLRLLSNLSDALETLDGHVPAGQRPADPAAPMPALEGDLRRRLPPWVNGLLPAAAGTLRRDLAVARPPPPLRPRHVDAFELLR